MFTRGKSGERGETSVNALVVAIVRGFGLGVPVGPSGTFFRRNPGTLGAGPLRRGDLPCTLDGKVIYVIFYLYANSSL